MMTVDYLPVLTEAQRRVVLSLSPRGCPLGCSYAVADRLAVPTKHRPALVLTEGRGMDRLYRLSPEGEVAKAALAQVSA
jgi:hypothetical protein